MRGTLLCQVTGVILSLGGAAVQFGVVLPYSRKHELQADRLGVDYMHSAGYDVKQSVRLWELMAAQSEGRQTTLGPYDFWAIEYAYKPLDPKDEAAELRAAAQAVETSCDTDRPEASTLLFSAASSSDMRARIVTAPSGSAVSCLRKE